MADDLYGLLAPYHSIADTTVTNDLQTSTYLARLSTLSLNDLISTEPASLLYSAQSHTRNLQALSKRSRNAVISSSTELGSLAGLLPSVHAQTETLKNTIPALEDAAINFAKKYDRSAENEVLDRRKRAALVSRNVDRLSDILDLPSLLSSTVSASQVSTSGANALSNSSTSYATALDIHAHIRRLRTLYPHSNVVGSINSQSEAEMHNLATVLITSLQSPSLKLASAMRVVGYLRRVAPDLVGDDHAKAKPGILQPKSLGLSANTISNDGPIGLLFLLCRLQSLNNMLEALEPLRELADQETTQRTRDRSNTVSSRKPTAPSTANTGSQSERFLKRYIEIFREQSFGILSMYKSIFPSDVPSLDPADQKPVRTDTNDAADPLLPLPSPVASFSLKLVDMFQSTLHEYMPNVTDRGTRESLLTQVLYCAGSLGRLGAEFGMMVALLDEDLNPHDEQSLDDVNTATRDAQATAEPEWVSVMQKHRSQASRLEILARGVGGGGSSKRAGGGSIPPPSDLPLAAG